MDTRRLHLLLALSRLGSMRAVAQLMRQNGLSSALLVSDPFHMLRLRLLATQLQRLTLLTGEPRYEEAAAKLSWQRTVDFFDKPKR